VLFAVLGSIVELTTWAVFVIQPPPFPVIEVVIVNDAVALCASEATAQRTEGFGGIRGRSGRQATAGPADSALEPRSESTVRTPRA
jgi:hypothetical protein